MWYHFYRTRLPAEADDFFVIHADEDLGGLGGALVKGAADAVYLGLDGLFLLGNLGVFGFEAGELFVESLQILLLLAQLFLLVLQALPQ